MQAMKEIQPKINNIIWDKEQTANDEGCDGKLAREEPVPGEIDQTRILRHGKGQNGGCKGRQPGRSGAGALFLRAGDSATEAKARDLCSDPEQKSQYGAGENMQLACLKAEVVEFQ